MFRLSVPALAYLGAVYFAAAAVAVSLTRFDGGLAFIWGANAILIGTLACTRRRHWPAVLATGWAASALATGLFGLGWSAAVPLGIANAGEAALAAWLLRRLRPAHAPFESLDWLFGFVAAVGIAAPLASGAAAAAVAHWVNGTAYLGNLVHWYAGHALGGITFTPLCIMVIRGDARRWRATMTRARAAEAASLLGLVAAVSAAVFAQEQRPLLFLPMLPIILATFRAGRFAAAIAVVLLALIGGALTLAGHGPVGLIEGSTGTRMQFLQFYLATTVLTVLPVSADLARRRELFRRLRESEARYRVLADHSTDIILNLGIDGRIRFASPSVRQLGGYAPDALIGRNALELVAPEHRGAVAVAHRSAIATGGAPVRIEYEAMTAAGERRWFETHTRAILDERGEVDGVISAIRDVSARKLLEAELSEAASTDALTGLCNRRALMRRLGAAVSAMQQGVPGGCIALFDLDHFKRINDGHGHAAGDRVLQRFAALAREAVRGGDLVARLGGEEFAILLPGATIDQAHGVCDRLRHMLAMTPVDIGGAAVRVTVSGGVTPVLAAGCAVTLEAADAALYRAKAAGRDRLALAA